MPTKIPAFGTGGDVSNPIRGNTLLMSDYADFLTGACYETFYFGDDATTGTNKLVLTPNTFSANAALTEASITSTSYTKLIDLDFDCTIEGERLIGGDFTVVVRQKIDESGASTIYGYPIVKVVHYDGSTETVIATVQGEADSSIADSTKTYTLKGTITKTHFQIGDILRLTVEGWGKVDAGVDAGDELTIYHSGSTYTYSRVHIPFLRLDEY